MADLLRTTAADITTTADGVDAAIAQQLADADTDITAAEGGINLELGTLIGTADLELSDSQAKTDKAIETLLRDTMRDVFMAESLLVSAGVFVPGDTGMIRGDLDDPTGDRQLARLMGQPPLMEHYPSDTVAAEPVAVDPVLTPVSLPDQPTSGLSAQLPGPGGTDTSVGSAPFVFPPVPPPPPGLPPPPPLVLDVATPGEPVPVPVPAPEPAPEPVPVPGPVPPPPPGVPPPPTACGSCCPAPVVTVVVPPASCPAPGTVPPIVPTIPPPPCDPATEPDCVSPPPPPPSGSPPPPPTPSPPPPPPPLTEPMFRGDPLWSQPDVCPRADAALREAYPDVRDSDTPMPSDISERGLFGTFVAGATYPVRAMGTASSWLLSGFDSEVADEAKKELGRYLTLQGIGTEVLSTLMDGVTKASVPNKPAAFGLGAKLAAARTAEERTGFPALYLMTADQYLFNYANPQFIPDQAALDAGWLTGSIDSAQWDCLTRALGNLTNLHRPIRDGKRNRVGINELVQLWLRKKLTFTELVDKSRALGVTEVTELNEFQELANFIPPYTDLVRFMVRDVADEKVAEQYQLDKDFTTKFAGPLKDWAAAQGIDASVFKYLWRAHWDIPSPSQLYEMFHRLRPERDEVRRWDDTAKLIGAEKTKDSLGPRPPVVTLSDVQTALEVDDKAPAWVPSLLAVAYHPITRTDAIDAYHAGVFGDTDLKTAMLDNGYTPANADTLVKLQQAKKGRRLANVAGTWTVRSVLKAYRDGTINGVKADQLLQPLVTDGRQRQQLLAEADDQVEVQLRQGWVKRARRAHLVGEWDNDQTKGALQTAGVPGPRAQQLVDAWEADRLGRYKEPTVKLLVQWATLNIISPSDAYQRCLRLGYNDVDAQRIVYQGMAGYRDKVVSGIRQQEADQRRIIKDMKQARKEATAELEKRQKQIQADMDKLQKERERIMKELQDRLPG